MTRFCAATRCVVLLCLLGMSSGSLLYAQGPVFFMNTFDVPPQLSSTKAPGVWYPDRFRPAIFEQYDINGEGMLRVGIRLADARVNRPPASQSTFSNTQGRKFDLGTLNSINTALTAGLYVGADWGTNHRMATIWSTAIDSAGSVTAYIIMGFRNPTGSEPGFYVYGYQNNNEYTLLPFSVAYGRWYSLTIALTDTAFVYSINGSVVLSDTTLNGTTSFSDIMLQAYSFSDSTLPAELQAYDEYDVFWDNVGAINAGGAVSVDDAKETSLTDFELAANYPNPFNPVTTFSFTIPTTSAVSLRVFDALGREHSEVLNEVLTPGRYSRQWAATGLSSGVYFYRLQAGAFTQTRKLILVR